MHKKISAQLFILLFFWITFTNGQNFKHPYSVYGIGKMYDENFVTNFSMGGLGIALNDKTSFSPTNPASYSENLFTTFNIGLRNSIQNLVQGDISLNKYYTNFGYFALGFPINRKHNIAGSFGLLPVSNIGYTDKYTYFDDRDSVEINEYLKMDGGFSKFYFGSSIKLFEKLSIGANAYYIFGNTSKIHDLDFVSTDFNSLRNETRKDYSGLGFDFGTQFSSKIGDNHQLVIGAIYSLPVNLSVNENTTIQTYEHEDSYKDSISYSSKDENSLQLPMTYGAGVMVTKFNVYKIGLEYKATQWSDFAGLEKDFQLNDSWKMSVGGEWIPKFDDPNKYFNRVAYRAGIKYAKSYLSIKNTDFQEVSFSIGAGFPIQKDYVSKINIGVEVGRIGKNENDLIEENFININVGFKLNDNLWFRKSKIN